MVKTLAVIHKNYLRRYPGLNLGLLRVNPGSIELTLDQPE
jgi:hypothetical protein